MKHVPQKGNDMVEKALTGNVDNLERPGVLTFLHEGLWLKYDCSNFQGSLLLCLCRQELAL